MRTTPSLALAAAAFTLALAPAAAVRAAEADPAAQTVQAFDDALLATMKQGASLGVKGRYKKLEPAVDKAFDLRAMARFAVGPAWTKFDDAGQALVVDAFKRLSVASYAHNFDSYDGETFTVDPQVDTRGVDKVVKTKLVPKSGAPTPLNYRMRASTGTWKIIDVFYQGNVSQLTTRRSDLASVSASGDAKAVAASLNAQADKLLK
ncbi:ABC transporter substrate-binding protein [Phenylobacterium montanum]|uniref:ABC transporter substrate-binding protein n=1 Tax=Phenylobacterium montanum TaxID=2823693 RepID=A0A975FWC0_9CAUL|nr:ABC transporter substrate-binding protein [Caulobacter sp. S6]QUD86169.1 ABC transporter substrate-binding protein [Caulobacter sp. S6]